jgi:hypothetical protein
MMQRFSNIYGCQTWHPAMICWGLGGFGVGLDGRAQGQYQRGAET